MDNIIEPNQNFDFTKLSLSHPSGIQGGAYFTKLEYNKKPLYIQTTKSLTRQGIVKTGKQYYCDLMFDKNSESLINWFENLEEKCQKLIFEKKESWFQNTLEESDIEGAFNSLIRVFKSGKYYLVRTNIKTNNTTEEPSIKIYNEDQHPIPFGDIKIETNIISILEVQGIKFTSRNFQIELELKQIMVLDNEPIFENFLIKSFKNNNQNQKPLEENNNIEVKLEDNLNKKDFLKTENLEFENNEKTTNEENLTSDFLEETNFEDTLNKESENEKSLEIVNIDFEDLNKEEKDELKEIAINVPLENNENTTIQLKKPNQVYFELYKEARKKVKEAKKNAIIAYLEAKNIKKTYMIENIHDSDSELDAEIEDFSEGELEDF